MQAFSLTNTKSRANENYSSENGVTRVPHTVLTNLEIKRDLPGVEVSMASRFGQKVVGIKNSFEKAVVGRERLVSFQVSASVK